MSSLEDLEIVAGHVWSAVGGVTEGDGTVTVAEVDPKRFGIETAAATEATWAPGENGDTKESVLATTRPYKPMDMMIVETLTANDGTIALVTGYSEILNVEINGVNQFNSKNPVPSACFGTLLSAPRPRVRFDTVQTSPSLTMNLRHIGTNIPASGALAVRPVFSGVAVKR
jgi:hypothetical protein